MKTILITGFDSFGGQKTNPSGEIARSLDGRMILGHRVVGAVVPTIFGDSLRELSRLVREVRPALVICLGVAGMREEITVERIAINIDDARIPDNAGRQPVDAPIVRGAPAAYWSGLPIKAIVAALKRRGIPASVSQTAGTYVCNHVFYGLMHLLRRRKPRIRGGFIHVPAPSRRLPLARMTLGIEIAITTSLKVRRDARVQGGAES